MKKFWHINSRTITVALTLWFVGTLAVLGIAHSTDGWIAQTLAFVGITFLPGVTLLRALGLRLKNPPLYACYSFGLGLLTLMGSGLIANVLLPVFGIDRPLETQWAIGTWAVCTAILIGISAARNKKAIRFRYWHISNIRKTHAALVLLSLLLPCLAVAGAFRLNNGGDALLAMSTLCLGAAFIIGLFLLRNHLSDTTIAWIIFMLGFTILLMTSLRGWDIVGHDIEREFHVFSLTHLHGQWDISLYRDPYNACLSITILPEILANMLHISGLVIFKVILQVVFAACPVVLYVLLRNYTSVLGALVGTLLFVCYPTFINDSAMLTRQGVAYLFFALSLYIMTVTKQTIQHKVLFLLCACGAIISHYSTAYMFVALFAVGVMCKLIIRQWQKQKHMRRRSPATVFSPFFAITLCAITFIWYVPITDTSTGLVSTLQKSLTNIPQLFSDDNKSSDTSSALLFAGGKTPADLYSSYLTTTQQKITPAAASSAENTPVLTDDTLPLTWLGEKARAIGIDPTLTSSMRQHFAKVLQLLAIAGVVFVAYRLLRKREINLSVDFIGLSIAGILLLGLMVALPVLSVNYGILRAFQQSLIFLLIPMVLLLVAVGNVLLPKIKLSIAAGGTVLIFFLFTGMFAQILGGVSPSFTMNNQGLYYNLYYAPLADTHAFAWLKQHVPKGTDTRAANFNRAIMRDPDYPFTRTGILPTQIDTKTFVYLDQAQVLTQKLYTYHESSPLIMTFPLHYYDQHKNQVYSTTSTRMYQ